MNISSGSYICAKRALMEAYRIEAACGDREKGMVQPGRYNE